MHDKISQNPPLLCKGAAGKRTCSILRVPKRLVDINDHFYEPNTVSIGPYHRGKPHFQMIEEHKWQYLGSLLNRKQTIDKRKTIDHYVKSIRPLETEARECYSETINLGSNEFVEMMVVDECFILELFRKVDDPKRRDPNDPIFKVAWILSFIFRDFLRLENQIPYFILEKLFEVTRLPDEESGPSLSLLALRFFKYITQRRDDIIQRHRDLKGLHLLDMVRSSFFPPDQKECPKRVNNAPTRIIHSVSNLRRLGIRLNPIEADSFLVVKFKHGVIEIPNIAIDDYTTSFLVNCVAFEQCHNSCSKHITTNATFLDCLVKTAKDVEYLYKRNIFDVRICTWAEVARFLNNLGRDIEFDIDMCYLSKLFNDVHHYYQNSWHAKWERFKYTYFDAPWSFIAAMAVLVFLLLKSTQTYIEALIYYVKHSKH